MKQLGVAGARVAALASVLLVAATALAAPMGAAPEDIVEIRAPLPIPPWWRWPLIGLLALGAVVACTLLWRYYQQRKQRGLTPLQRALLALDQAEKHAQHDRGHEWAEIVAKTLREALAARVGTEVLPQTTAELARAAWAEPVEAHDEGDDDTTAPPAGSPARLPQAPELLQLLSICDIARFARAHIEVSVLLAHTGRARELVQQLMSTEPVATKSPKVVVQPNPEPLTS